MKIKSRNCDIRNLTTDIEVKDKGLEAIFLSDSLQNPGAFFRVSTFIAGILILVMVVPVYTASGFQTGMDIPPILWGEEGARENMLKTTNRWHAYDNTPLPPADLATHGPAVPAFPGAEGYGAYSFGGRGGKLYRVTNLNDSGPGSFREAATAEEPRVIIFDVSGTIELESPVRIYHPYVTIAGQTASGDGITIANRQVDIRTYDVILRHIRFRHGEGDRYHGDEWMLRTRGGNHVIMDHVTISWGVDGNLGVTFVDNVTVQNSILSKPLWNSLHPKGERGYGALVRGRHGARYSFLRNLWANHRTRVPRPGNYISYDHDPDGVLMDFRNNVIYQGMGANYDTDSVTKYNYVNNYFLTDWYMIEESTRSQGYLDGNILIDEQPDDEWRRLLRTNFFIERDYHEQSEPFDPGLVTTLQASEALDQVMEQAGMHIRDQHDTLVIQEIANYRRTEIEGVNELYAIPQWWQEGAIDHEDEVGGLPGLEETSVPKWVDTNRNGLPDWWEQEQGLDSKNPDIAHMDSNGNGYTNLEDYINDLDAIKKTWDMIASTSVVQAETTAEQEGFSDYFRLVTEDQFDFTFIEVIEDAPDQQTAPDEGHLIFQNNLEGQIHIWLLVSPGSSGSNSFFIRFSDADFKQWEFSAGEEEWKWVRYKVSLDNGESAVTGSGDDYLMIAPRQKGAALDRVLFTSDLDYVPSDPNRQEVTEPLYHEILAETASTQEGFDDYFEVVDVSEHGYAYIEATADSPEREESPEDGILSFSTQVEGPFNIWLLVNMAGPDSDSFFTGLDSHELKPFVFTCEDHVKDYGAWVWTQYKDPDGVNEGSFAGSGNEHLYLTRRDAGARLDRVMVTDDLAFVPVDPDRERIPAFAGELADIPTSTGLHQNYPNPFNPVTNIRYDLDSNQPVRIELYNAIGQRVRVLFDGRRPAGTHTIRFDGSTLPSGIYLYRLQTENVTETRKMTLVK